MESSNSGAGSAYRRQNRHRPAPDISPSVGLRTSSRHVVNTAPSSLARSPPSTPPPIHRRANPNTKSKGKEAVLPAQLRHQLAREHSDTHRHSHGLSWSSTTRDSVVDNLLLSLDGLSTTNLGLEDDLRDRERAREMFGVPHMPEMASFPSRPLNRARGHTYSSSLSSGPGSAGVESPGSRQSRSVRGRRSASSSNFGTIRSHNVRTGTITAQSSPEIQTPVQEQNHGKSQSTDLDGSVFGGSAVMDDSRLKFAGRRSMSMDQMYHEALSEDSASVLARGRPVPSVHSRYEAAYCAAPEPGIPAGPRRKQNPTGTGPVYIGQTASKQNIRKVNTQSDLRGITAHGTAVPSHIHAQANDFVRANSLVSTGVPTIPMPYEHSAAAPSPSFKHGSQDSPHAQRDRPGFFKRVFGSTSRSASGLSMDSQETIAQVPDRSRSQTSHDLSAQLRSDPRNMSRERQQTSYPPPALNKKPSSFFRRRKKSTSEMNAPPPLPTSLGYNASVRAAEPSPSMSSLRKVMDPYLSKEGLAQPPHSELPRPSTQDSTAESSDLDIFHSGYTPPPDASLGRRDPMTRISSHPKQSAESTRDSPRMKLKVKKRQPEVGHSSHSQSQDTTRGISMHDAGLQESASAAPEADSSSVSDDAKVSPLTESGSFVDHSENERPISRASTGENIIATQPSIFGTAVSGMPELARSPADITHSLDGWVITHPRIIAAPERPLSKKSERIILQPTDSDEIRQNALAAHLPREAGFDDAATGPRAALPRIQHTASSSEHTAVLPSVYHSASSLPLPTVQVDGIAPDQTPPRKSSLRTDEGAEYRERARKIYEGDEGDLTKGEAAAWLGERNALSTNTLNAYMQLFDFAGANILSALRTLCSSLLLKGETQQVDRVITALSERWCSCNPNHGFKAQDVVHTMFYSLILLNTDLHLADIGEKMSKSAYVKNTLPTIRRVVTDAAPDACDDTVRPAQTTARPFLPWNDTTASAPAVSSPVSPGFPPDSLQSEHTSLEAPRGNLSKRMSMRPGMFRGESDGWSPSSGNTAYALVNEQWKGSLRGWEEEIEAVLKSFFASIRSDPLPLLGTSAHEQAVADRSLSAANLGGLKRSGSVVSKAPSENASYRSKPGFRTLTQGWQNRNTRSRPKLYPTSLMGSSSRTSFDDGNSVWSPAQSSNFSKNSFSKTLTSASMSSLGYHLTPAAADYKHSIGFANALSHAIIREEGIGSSGEGEADVLPGGLLEDEGLALEGAPWAKEGLVKHKHHLETVDKKAKERSWVDCFAVISKGKLTIFAFGTSTKSHSVGRKNQAKQNGGRAASLAPTKVGGGDWMENAEQLDSFVLRHTIASTLPKPGYSKARPHVWALSLPSGAVHLFQVGTPEIAKEFMTSANYWSARLSKEPLSGSVSNVEYGWSDQVINTAVLDRRPESRTAINPPATSTNAPPGSMSNKGHLHSASTASGPTNSRPSFQSSVRGSFDTGFGSSGRNRMPGDKVHVTDWQPPSQSMMASQLMEVDQLSSLTAYVHHVERDLERHNDLKHAIELAYSPRQANHNRAMINWQRKSDYLLREIVKFRTYMDSLSAAQEAKARYDAKKAAENAVKRAVSPVDSGRPVTHEGGGGSVGGGPRVVEGTTATG
ncbi:hypothetical protein LTR62_008121 [Meristemomyces frigidus]|uniref:SEC7 domain-containing protein n=1 Tax=Meristemomyces frigidus TaxID=1508187 RepID=A0AAN7YM18_9PEZI|nr:hypothetical protein LTR62_008121 [Meristemomyces frigidus]